MTAKERFRQTMHYGPCDRPPYFEEGIRDDVLRTWRKQGLLSKGDFGGLFPSDERVEIEFDLEPRPGFKKWPASMDALDTFRKRLDPLDPKRMPRNWLEIKRTSQKGDAVLMLEVHEGFFLSMGVGEWHRFETLMYLLTDEPEFVRRAMTIQGEFCAALAEKMLSEIKIDAAIFSEPIGENKGPLISPAMYEDIVLKSYAPLLKVLRSHAVDTIIFRTYANARIFIPLILKWGFNCLWACEVECAEMDYRALRKTYGRDLRLIGGIDLDVLRLGKDAIQKELEEKVPPLLSQGGYVPLADGRVRADIPFENYAFYRNHLKTLIQG